MCKELGSSACTGHSIGNQTIQELASTTEVNWLFNLNPPQNSSDVEEESPAGICEDLISGYAFLKNAYQLNAAETRRSSAKYNACFLIYK